MAGTKAGGIAARDTNKRLYGADFYSKIGGMTMPAWIENGRKPRGFAWMKVNGQTDRIRQAGAKGGRISRRPKKQGA